MMGRTFIVPLATAAYGTDGRLGTAFRNAANNALATYVGRVSSGTPGHPVVWKHPHKGQTNGQTGLVTSAAVGLKVAELSRRRD
jgi:hypothetical protein